MRERLSVQTEGEDSNSSIRSRYQVELANLVRRWRLSSQSHNFGKR
jgi:hypothetical protein